MPGWHADTQDLQKSGAFQMLGIIQEQHPDRCALFMQWKQMTWPVLVDSLNLYGIDVVPVTYAIDEHGIVRHLNPTREQFKAFLATPYERPSDGGMPEPGPPDLGRVQARARKDASSSAWMALGEALFLWGGEGRLDAAVDAFGRAARLDPGNGAVHFRLGTALRRRHETNRRRRDDFRQAVDHWVRALEINPNQYIWRRRIQQYGPRLDKPYPFYDWIDQARLEVRARGETPAALRVEAVGAEIAQPSKTFDAAPSAAEPDPGGRIIRDNGRLILPEIATVPPRIAPNATARVHITLRPNAAVKAHWNNEVEPLRVWVAPPAGWSVDHRILTTPNPPLTLSTEPREVQFEIRAPADATGDTTIRAYALYYVCEDIDGTCLYRRQDLVVPVQMRR